MNANIPLKSKLKTLGLSDNEADVYIFLLHEGQASAKEIFRSLSLTRATIYNILDDLTDFGLLSSVQQSNKKIYICESPTNLQNFIHKRFEQLKIQERLLADSMSQFMAEFQKSRTDWPQVTFFEGMEGLIACQDELIRSRPKKAYEIVNMDLNPFKVDLREAEHTKHKIQFESIYTSEKGETLDPKSKDSYFLPRSVFSNFNIEIVIYRNRVLISTVEHKIRTIVIDNEEIADAFLDIFHIIKEKAKEKK
ncbi:MAG: hypothetical protein A3F54_03170 [Candidatus Kerfeldbacteria bacterium RIFCSPHIGHO2_12_FULL_48_17]|uniref:Transcription regulator TrmB N-terminal domain-containing protein n=1 Tax=Candidatus Kerfeldbacteria bacterium RIFCSPHIGHO2_12_FULL_48_17 TaxID=1798542 RepID=A0A1G2B6E3_9BACT|nr:MAG: hypothetical protein A3F54_03170 [Candidatus Kerfeldbacteria bacterium RIFCSPHIGHO2_12_FULL_48_17]